jgi:ADP-ribosylglycohydrolase
MPPPISPAAWDRALAALDGLSVGDGFGECFFAPDDVILARIRGRALPPAPWRWTDDTQMALSILDTLRAHGTIDQDDLATRFAARFEPARGYGEGASMLLERVRAGTPWQAATRSLFRGVGSFGNGAAMRVAPLGALFADDLDRVIAEAGRSAEVTHAHDEGIAGGVAVAVAAALASSIRSLAGADFLREVARHTPAGYTRDGVVEAAGLAADTGVVAAALALGNGSGVTAPDTVPFALWCAARHLDDYPAAMWLTVAGLGDRDTTCAIAGGVVGARVGAGGIPAEWRAAREPLGWSLS